MKRPEGFDPPPQAPPAASSRRATARRLDDRGEKANVAPIALARPARRERSRDAPGQRRATDDRAANRAAARAARAQARRFTRGSRRRRLAIASVVGILALLAAVLAVAVFSPILALRTIRVEGNSAIRASTVQDALAPQLGTPLALLDDGKIRSELSSIILIRSYVTEVVPPGTLVVRIIERKAIGVLQRGSAYEQVDAAGVVLATSSTAAGLPVIQIGSAGVDSPGFAAAVKVLLAMPASVLGQVASISATTLDNVSITLTQGSHVIIWGSAAQSDLKARALAILLKSPNCATQTVLNVTAPMALACGPAQPTPTPTPTFSP